MKPFRLRLAAMLLIVFGLIPFGFALWISGWQRIDRDGPAFRMPGNGGGTVKAEILPLLGQIGGALIGFGIVMLLVAQVVAFRQRRAIESGAPLPERRPASPIRALLTIVFAAIIALTGTIGWRWYDYVTSAPSPYDEVGIGLTGWMPEPIRQWGCSRMHERFKGALPPMGCGDATGKGWR